MDRQAVDVYIECKPEEYVGYPISVTIKAKPSAQREAEDLRRVILERQSAIIQVANKIFYTCPRCSFDSITIVSSYCSGCGTSILWEED